MDQRCVLWDTRVIIPEVLQGHLLNELDQNIEDMVKSCRDCTTQRSLPPVAPLHSWPWANQPMKPIHTDFAEIEGWQVLVIIDVHSKCKLKL